MRTALFSSTLVVNYRALILYKGYFVEAATLEYITGACMSTYRMAMYNSEHRRYDTYLSFRRLVIEMNSTCEMKTFCFST